MISVIVPFWNSEKWIGRCCDSLVRLKGDFEFLLIDDNSTDKGPEIVRRYDDDRLVLLQNWYRYKGVSGARNTGLDSAKGEWVTFLDADDEMLPEASQVFERMIRLDKTANILQSNHLRYYEKTGKTALKYANPKGVYDLEHLPQCWCMVWNKLIRRSFIEEHDIRFIEGLQYGEDEVFVLDCLAHDNRIIHTMTRTVTIMRHFDNKGSLSHVKRMDPIGLMAQTRALEKYIMRTDNADARIAACKILSEHWGSATYLKTFGGE